MAQANRHKVYSPLPDSTSIRLITVHSASEDKALVSCDLSVMPLANATPYAALSYTWGKEDFDKTVDVNGTPIFVTNSCYTALMAFRDEWHDAPIIPSPRTTSPELQAFRRQRVLTLWVDQLCISQTDDAEKSDQILLMSDIFAGAVVVWAWTESQDLEEKFEVFDQADLASTTQGITTKAPEHRLLHLLEYYDRNSKHLLSPNYVNSTREILDATAWYCLFKILSRPYWKRRWILQEIHARDETFTLFAKYLISVSTLFQALSFIGNSSMRSRIERGLPSAADWHHAFQISASSDISTSQLSDMGRGKQNFRRQPWHMLFLLVRLGCSETSRLEDTFFALRSFLPEDSDLPRPVYGGDPLSLVLQHAGYFVKVGFAAAMLQYSGLAWRRTRGMPSWCPDFYAVRANDSLTRVRLNLNPSDREAFFAASHETARYRLDGQLFQTVCSFQCKLRSKEDVDRKQRLGLATTLPRCYRFVRDSRNTIMLRASEAIEALVLSIKTMSLDNVKVKANVYRHPLTRLSIVMQTFLVPLTEEDVGEEALQERLGMLCFNLFEGGLAQKYGLFVTDTGLLGICTRRAKVGDDVVLFPGCWLPMIVRKTEEDRYEVVADAFVLGLRGRYYMEEDQLRTFDLDERALCSVTLV